MKIKALLFLLIFIGNQAFCQDKDSQLSIMLLANDKIAEVNIDDDSFIKSLKKISDYLSKDFKDFPKDQKIGVLIIFHTQGSPTYRVYSSPKMSTKREEAMIENLKEIKTSNTKIVDFPMLFTLNVSIQEGKAIDFEGFVNPATQKLEEYKSADLKTKLQLNKEYVITEVLPVLTAFQTSVDKQFEGVKNFGNMVEKTNFGQLQDVFALTSKNNDYWRACMEMSVGNQLITVTKVAMLIAQGELDYAQKYIEILRIFSDPKAVASHYLNELTTRLILFNKDLNGTIENGIAAHDKGDYQQALDIYNSLLAQYPNSSWALYEKYYSGNSLDIDQKKINKDNRANWDMAKSSIYQHNPLYPLDIRASSKKEAYLLYRRQEMKSLFQDEDKTLSDMFKYAEISLDLGVYDFAAQLFWLTGSFDKENAEKAIHYCLYCLEKLEVKDIKRNFKGNFENIFNEIDQERQKKMQSNIFYNSFKD